MARTPIQIGDLRDVLTASTQGFIDETATIAVPFTTVVNRAQIPDISKDFRAWGPVNRIMMQDIFPINTESGPNGEPVWGVLNDVRGLIRLVGLWIDLKDNNGYRPYANTNLTTDYIEITFIGTGLDFMHYYDAASRTVNVTVDGVFNQTLTFQSSTVLNARGYGPNYLTNAVKGLSYGIHTVKLTPVTSPQFVVYGFQVLNESTSITVNPGTAYLSGQKLSSSASQVFAYNSVVTGTKGGRVLVYLDSTGTVQKLFQAVNATQQNLTSTDHTNEEPFRVFNWREFGANRSDDLSNLFLSTLDMFFTLDDAVTTLAVHSHQGTIQNGYDTLQSEAAGAYATFTFVGTGLDIDFNSVSLSGTGNVIIDGVTVSTTFIPTVTTGICRMKICSGLPYGTHTVRILYNSYSGACISILRFITYQPKKPTLPANSLEIADYNVMANFVQCSSGNALSVSNGVLRRAALREFVYSFGGGSWSADSAANSIQQSSPGVVVTSPTTSNYFETRIMATGFDLRCTNFASPPTVAITINGLLATTANFPTLVASVGGAAGASFNTSNGQWALGTFNSYGMSLAITGLPFGSYEIRATFVSGAGSFELECIDMIVPIHSLKSNLFGDIENTLTVGSQSISDNRKTSPYSFSRKKNYFLIKPYTSIPSTTSTNFVPMSDMCGVIYLPEAGEVEMYATADVSPSAGGIRVDFQFYVNGFPKGTAVATGNMAGGTGDTAITVLCITALPAGYHFVQLYWRTSSGTLQRDTAFGTMIVKER